MSAATIASAGSVLDAAVAARATADAAEVELLRAAVAFAEERAAAPDSPEQELWRIAEVTERWSWLEYPGELDATADPNYPDSCEEWDWYALPVIDWDAPAEFGAALGLSTLGGRALLRDALVLRHRLPQLWARVDNGQVLVWRARKIAQAVLGAPRDVVEFVDEHLTPVADHAGAVAIERMLDRALMVLHAEEREVRLAELLTQRSVTVRDDLDVAGMAYHEAHGDADDLHALDATLTRVAAALKADAEPGTDLAYAGLDERRAIALGVLADPHRAAALLDGAAGRDLPAARREVVLHVHLTERALTGADPLAHPETSTGALATRLATQVATWCGRPGTTISVRPVLDLSKPLCTGAYAIPDRIRDHVILTHPTCVFPGCTRPSRSCDLDHVVPFADGGPTHTANLAPLCRHHHRLKTHAGWTYHPLDPVTDPGVFVWTDPHHRTYLRRPPPRMHSEPSPHQVP